MRVLILFLLLPFSILAQPMPQLPDRIYQYKDLPEGPALGLVKGLAFLPGRMQEVHGLTISANTSNKLEQPLEIHGMNIDFNPLAIFISPYMVFFHPVGVIKHPEIVLTGAQPIFTKEDTAVQIHGFDLRLIGSFPPSSLDGLGLTAGVSTYPRQRGAAISLFGNVSTELHGIQLSIFGNTAETGRGIQIGLFNRAEQCNCLQLGLLNRNGNTLLPFINWKRKQHV